MATAHAKPEAVPQLREAPYVPEAPSEEERIHPRPVVRFRVHTSVKVPTEPEPAPLTEPEAIRAVLEKAARDRGFIADLTYRGSEALAGYPLSWEAKAALVSGDVGWIEAKLGKLDARLRTWLDCRLQQEIW